MFRAQIRWFESGPTVKLEGQLIADWVEQARCLITETVVPHHLVVDLSQVTAVDSTGEQFLSWLAGLGAVFEPGNGYAVSVCCSLRLPLFQARGKPCR